MGCFATTVSSYPTDTDPSRGMALKFKINLIGNPLGVRRNGGRTGFWNRSSRSVWRLLAVFSAVAALSGQSAQAGLSSENVIVVVNGDSMVSRTVANHYIEARSIPSKNVIVLQEVPSGIKTDLDSFRDKILKPVLAEIDKRGISSFAQVIAYSADFPTAVNIASHCEKLTESNAKKYQLPTASITGLTYFYRHVLADDPAYLSFASNLYSRGKFERYFLNPFANDKKTQFDDAVRLQEEQKYAESAAIWTKLQEAHPTMPALALRAAENFSLDDQPEQAVTMIRAALKAGWWSATYLRDTPALKKHLDAPEIQRALPLLDDSPIAWQGPEAFSSSVGWTLTGSRVPIKDGGLPYLCSCSLAVVNPNGSSLSDAVRILLRASKADRTFPSGRFAFGTSGDVRSTTRFPNVTDAVVYLQENGFETEVFSSVMPKKPGAIVGLMVGTAQADLLSNQWIFVRGAISDNLTSLGGAFQTPSQTKLTAFLSAGAAMSSGAVAEPYSLQFKFPTPMMYGYYARGLSIIECFYQSVASPYQLLIVGDPLTQPFAKAPDELVDVSLVDEGKRRLRLSRRSLGLKVPQSPTASIEISINDRAPQVTPAVPNIEINWPENTSGIYDIRVTLTGLDRTRPRITFLSEIDVEGKFPPPIATITKTRTQADGFGNDGSNATPLEVTLECHGADRIVLKHWGDSVAEIKTDVGVVKVDTNALGGGPLRFRPVAYFGETEVLGRTIIDQLQPAK